MSPDANGWMPIETAPRDRAVLLWVSDFAEGDHWEELPNVVVGRWYDFDERHPEWAHWRTDVLDWAVGEMPTNTRVTATHWREVPAGPVV
jgi:hypothetical protein